MDLIITILPVVTKDLPISPRLYCCINGPLFRRGIGSEGQQRVILRAFPWHLDPKRHDSVACVGVSVEPYPGASSRGFITKKRLTTLNFSGHVFNVRPTLMGTKNLYEKGPDPFFLYSFNLMGTRMAEIRRIAKSV